MHQVRIHCSSARDQACHLILGMLATVGLSTACDMLTGPSAPTVAEVVIAPNTETLIVTTSRTLVAQVRASNGAPMFGQTVDWSAGDTAVISVMDGVVTAKRPGVSSVTARVGVHVGQATITVIPVPAASVSVVPATVTLYENQSAPLTATVMDSTGAALEGRGVQWTTTDTTVATVSASGVVSARRAGTANITATSEGKSASATITVMMRVASVMVSPTAVVVPYCTSATLTATVLDSAGAVLQGRTVTWATSDASVARVTPTGVVSCVAPGTASITATSEGVQKSATVTVGEQPVLMELSPASTWLGVGWSVQLSALVYNAARTLQVGHTITWSTSDSTVAVVDQSGLVTARRTGAVGINAMVSTEGCACAWVVAKADIFVQEPAAQIIVTATTNNLAVGQSTPVEVQVLDSAGRALIPRFAFSSSDSSVAGIIMERGCTAANRKVVPLGNITRIEARKPGVATIAAAWEGVTGSTTITVVRGPYLRLVCDQIRLTSGWYTKLQVEVVDETGQVVPMSGTPTFSSSRPDVATVDETGYIDAPVGSSGTTIITVRYEGLSVTAMINVI